MKSMLRIFGYTALMGAMVMFAGCGDDSEAPPTVTNGTQITADKAKLNDGTGGTVAGTVTTTAAVTATNSGGGKITIPAGTVITAKDAAGATIPFTALPVINVSTPVSGVTGMPQPKTSGFVVGTAAAAIDVTIPGASSVTFSSPVTLTIPIPINNVPFVKTTVVQKNKNDGNGWINLGPVGPGALVFVPGLAIPVAVTVTTSDLCWFAMDLTFNSTTTTGSTGGSGTSSGF
jgi:hypothetical protein